MSFNRRAVKQTLALTGHRLRLATRMKALWFQGWAPCLCYGSITNIPSIPWGGVSLRILTPALRSRPYCHSSQSEKQTREVRHLAKQGPSWLVRGEPKLKPRSLSFCQELSFPLHWISLFVCFPSIHCSPMLLLEAGYSGKPMKRAKIQQISIDLSH